MEHKHNKQTKRFVNSKSFKDNFLPILFFFPLLVLLQDKMNKEKVDLNPTTYSNFSAKKLKLTVTIPCLGMDNQLMEAASWKKGCGNTCISQTFFKKMMPFTCVRIAT